MLSIGICPVKRKGKFTVNDIDFLKCLWYNLFTKGKQEVNTMLDLKKKFNDTNGIYDEYNRIWLSP